MEVDCEQRSSWKLIKQGAEARVYKGEHSGRPIIIKERFSKSYRVPALDQRLTTRRMNQEVRSMARCQKNNIRTPEVYRVDNANKMIYMECIEDGLVLKEYINQFDLVGNDSDAPLAELMKEVGEVLARMHNIDLIHGDLTTSNMIYNSGKSELIMIDFGLSFVSNSAEDKGVDLYVLERAFLSTHPNTEALFKLIIESYRPLVNNGDAIIKKMDEVRTRGRKRTMVG